MFTDLLTVSNVVEETDIMNTKEKNCKEELHIEGGKWHGLPSDICDKIWYYIGASNIDMIGYISMASKQHIFRPTEACYRYFCEVVFVGQTSRGRLRIEKWMSWRRMFILRPRLRTNGFYCLRSLYSRAPNNDNFWEPKRTQSVEVIYFRYLRFFNNGSVLYALSTVEPHVMTRQLLSGLPEEKRIFLGHYTLRGRNLEIEVTICYFLYFMFTSLLLCV